MDEVASLLHPMLPGPKSVRIAGPVTSIGRGELGTSRKLVSKVHLSIAISAKGESTITDLSTNGTWLNGVRLRRDEPSPLEDGAIITLLTAESIDFCFVFVQGRPEGAPAAGVNPLHKLVKRLVGLEQPEPPAAESGGEAPPKPVNRLGRADTIFAAPLTAAEEISQAVPEVKNAAASSRSARPPPKPPNPPPPPPKPTKLAKPDEPPSSAATALSSSSSSSSSSSVASASPGCAPETAEWFFVSGAARTKHGPVTRSQLVELHIAGDLEDETLVWCPSMAEWSEYSEVGPGLLAQVGAALLADEPDVTAAADVKTSVTLTHAARLSHSQPPTPQPEHAPRLSIDQQERLLNRHDRLSIVSLDAQLEGGDAAGSDDDGDEEEGRSAIPNKYGNSHSALSGGGGSGGSGGDGSQTVEQTHEEIVVVLPPRGAGGLGLGLSEHARVTELHPGKLAATHGGIHLRDKVLAVNGRTVDRGTAIAQLMPPKTEAITLVLQRRIGSKGGNTKGGASSGGASDAGRTTGGVPNGLASSHASNGLSGASALAQPGPPPPVHVPPTTSRASMGAGGLEPMAEETGDFDNDSENDSSGYDSDEIIGVEEDEALLARVRRDSEARRSSDRADAVSSALNTLGGSSGGATSGASQPLGRRSSAGMSSQGGSRRGSAERRGSAGRISEMLAEVGMGQSTPGSPRPSIGAEDARSAQQKAAFGYMQGDELGSPRGGGGGGTLAASEEEEEEAHAARRTTRQSVVVGRGSASMFDASIRRGAVPVPLMSLDENGEALSRRQDDDDEKPAPRDSRTACDSSGLLVPLEQLIDWRLNHGRGYVGIMEEETALSLEELVCALTHPSWQGVSAIMALEANFDTGGDWTPPEYHMLVVSFLCSYKRYVTSEALLAHLSTLYAQLGALNLPPSAPKARAAQTTRERVLYVLVLWARRHPTDFDSTPLAASAKSNAGRRGSLTTTPQSLRQNLMTFVSIALVEVMEVEGSVNSDGARYLTTINKILEEHTAEQAGRETSESSFSRGRSNSSPGEGGRSRGHSNGYGSGYNSDYSSEYGGRGRGDSIGSAGERGIRSASPAPGMGGRARSATSNAISALAMAPVQVLRRQDTRPAQASITQGGDGREFGVDYWRRLLAGPQSAERGYVRELAEQLAVHEGALLRSVRASELQDLAFAKAATKHERAPNVLMLINHFNRMSRWVCTQVVKQSSVRERARCLRLYIEFARSCHEVGNLNGVMEVVAALNSAALYRLKRTWEALPKASRRDFEDLCTLVKPDRSHAALRQAMRQAARAGATVPYLGLYLTDLTFVEEGSSDFVDADDGSGEKLINLGKCAMLGKCIGEILAFQSAGLPPYESNEPLALYFTGLDPPEDDEIYALSLAAEPRDGSSGGGGGGYGGAADYGNVGGEYGYNDDRYGGSGRPRQGSQGSNGSGSDYSDRSGGSTALSRFRPQSMAAFAAATKPSMTGGAKGAPGNAASLLRTASKGSVKALVATASATAKGTVFAASATASGAAAAAHAAGPAVARGGAMAKGAANAAATAAKSASNRTASRGGAWEGWEYGGASSRSERGGGGGGGAQPRWQSRPDDGYGY